MASLTKSKGKSGTMYRIEFFLPNDPLRKCIRLGKIDKRQAESIKARVELLIAAKTYGHAPDGETSRWVAERDHEFHAKLSDKKIKLVPPRSKSVITKLGEFLDEYIDGRTDVKLNTRTNLKGARN